LTISPTDIGFDENIKMLDPWEGTKGGFREVSRREDC